MPGCAHGTSSLQAPVQDLSPAGPARRQLPGPTPAGDLSLRADYAWQDKIQFNVINDFNYQGAYGTANARVALASRAHT